MSEEGSHAKTELLRLKVLDLESITCARNTGKAAWLEPGVPGEDEGTGQAEGRAGPDHGAFGLKLMGHHWRIWISKLR